LAAADGRGRRGLLQGRTRHLSRSQSSKSLGRARQQASVGPAAEDGLGRVVHRDGRGSG